VLRKGSYVTDGEYEICGFGGWDLYVVEFSVELFCN
jgi:hypothetical protein